MERKNADIRRAAASAGVKLWQIAEGLGVNDGNFSRRLRRELSADLCIRQHPGRDRIKSLARCLCGLSVSTESITSR